MNQKATDTLSDQGQRAPKRHIVSYPKRGGILPEAHGKGGGPVALCREKGTLAKLGIGVLADRHWFLTPGFQIKEPGQILLPIDFT